MPYARKSISRVRTALTLIGFSAVIGQIVLMRELIVVFGGNEMSMGVMLASWLLWTAAGSSLAGGFGLGRNNPRIAVAGLELLLSASLPATIWALRDYKFFFQKVPGELTGPLQMLCASVTCLSVICAVSGALFVVAARMYESECGVSARTAASSAYLLEAAGSALGGLVASIVLLRCFESFQIAAIVALLNLCMAAVLLLRMSGKQVIVLTASATLIAVPLLLTVAPALSKSAQSRLWRGFELVASRDTIYGNLTVTQTGTIRSIYDNGAILANVPDENAAEEAVHFALLEHPAPRRVLLIGGGVNGSIAQALKHPSVAQIDYVELDPALIGMVRRYFPKQSVPVDSRVHFHYTDGRRYLQTDGNKFDVIVVDVPDPQTAQLNRFYTAEFFRSAREHLAPGGLLALELHSSAEAISPDLAEFLRCIRRTLGEVFPDVAVIPGETIHLFGAMRPGDLTEDPRILMVRLRDRRLHTQYVNEYFIPYRMMPDRMAQVREQLQPLNSTPVNHDFAPIAYYFDVVLWSAQFNSGDWDWFRAAAHIPFRVILGATVTALLVAAVLLALLPGRQRRVRSAAAYCTLATGFTLMVLQIFLLLAFQAIYGYVYHQLAILIGLFMAGIALGSWLGILINRSNDRGRCRTLATTQLLLALSGPALLLALSMLANVSGIAATWIVAQLVFPGLAALAGMLGGCQFPVAIQIFFDDRERRSGLGALYAIDLLGGCAGAVLLSSYVIPVFGFWNTAWLSAAINLVPALLAARACLDVPGSRESSLAECVRQTPPL